MGKLWNRAAGALKDKNSVLVASLSRRTALRNPEVEAAVIRATSHDDSVFDYESVEKVYRWIRLSPNVFKPLIWAISRRMEKTRNWVVALKGLMLMHGVFCSKIPAVRRIGRLPFDLSNFRDGSSLSGKMWAHNEFIRAYFAFLDQKSALIFLDAQQPTVSSPPLMQVLDMLQKMQDLLDKTFKIRPSSPGTVVPLVIEAMDCVVVEIFDIHIRIRTGIAKSLSMIRAAGKEEAETALKIAARVRFQSQLVDDYFDLCNELGVTNAAKPPTANPISKDQIQELEDIINGLVPASRDCSPAETEVKENSRLIPATKETHCTTIITDRWETFGEDSDSPPPPSQPVLSDNDLLQLQCKEHFPDLITFDQ